MKEIIEQNQKHVQLHSFGLGNGIRVEEIIGIAKAGKGTYYLVQDNDNLKEFVIKGLNKASQPAMSNVQVKLGCQNLVLEAESSDYGEVYRNEGITYLAILKKSDFEDTTL